MYLFNCAQRAHGMSFFVALCVASMTDQGCRELPREPAVPSHRATHSRPAISDHIDGDGSGMDGEQSGICHWIHEQEPDGRAGQIHWIVVLGSPDRAISNGRLYGGQNGDIVV